MNKQAPFGRSTDGPSIFFFVLFCFLFWVARIASPVAVSQTAWRRNIIWRTEGSTEHEVPLESHTQNTNSRYLVLLPTKWLIMATRKRKTWQVYENRTESGHVRNLQCVMSLLSSCKHQQSKGRTASLAHREHLDCKHFNVQTHGCIRYTSSPQWPFALTHTR